MAQQSKFNKIGLEPLMGPQLRTLRLASKRSLADVAAETGVSEATMSRIETGRSDVSAPHLMRLANLFEVEVSSFFQGGHVPGSKGVRSIARKGDGRTFDTARMETKLLCTELQKKKMHPFLNRVNATDLDAVGGLAAHQGEEYLFVTEGVLVLHTDTYAPLTLECGDSIYFDATMPHAYVAAGAGGAQFLVICSAQ